MASMPDASHLYAVERRERHAVRDGFRISELQISPEQFVPWHHHTHVQDAFYLLEGEIILELRAPEATVTLRPGDTYSVVAGRPHRVTNPGTKSATFFIMQGIGTYDYVPDE